MAKKTTTSRAPATGSTAKTAAGRARPKPALAATAKAKVAVKPSATPSGRSVEARPAEQAPVQDRPRSTADKSTAGLLARAEADITAAIEAMNNQMNSAMSRLTELAAAQCGKGHAVVRTAPLDRATATFQRLVAEVIDDQLAEMLPPLINLRNECAQRVDDDGPEPTDDFARRGKDTLDHVLALASVQSYEPRLGEPFDPLIHLAVGECHRQDLAANSVGQTVQPGFRSTRGKVLVAAKVLVNRR